MASIGPKLQEARLKKGLSLERIADGTNISIRFLSKLENDDFTGFPGETYITGFIRNYAEYLGMDFKAILASYRGIEAGPDAPEAVVAPAIQPVIPVEPAAKHKTRLTARRLESVPLGTPNRLSESASLGNADALAKETIADSGHHVGHAFGKVAVALSILVVAAAAFWILAGGILSAPNIKAGPKAPVEYRVEGSPFEMRLYVGDSLLIPLGEEVYKVTLGAIDDTVELDTPFGRQSLKLGESGTLDTNVVGTTVAILSVVDFEKRRPSSGALINVSSPVPALDSVVSSDVTVSGKAPTLGVEATTGTDKAKLDSAIVFRSPRGPYPYIVQVSFRGSCLFRYEADRKEWVEKYYSKGETATINVNAALVLWTSNAQAAKLSFQASGGKLVDFELGSAGEIAVKRISWDNVEGSWALVASSLD